MYLYIWILYRFRFLCAVIHFSKVLCAQGLSEYRKIERVFAIYLELAMYWSRDQFFYVFVYVDFERVLQN